MAAMAASAAAPIRPPSFIAASLGARHPGGAGSLRGSGRVTPSRSSTSAFRALRLGRLVRNGLGRLRGRLRRLLAAALRVAALAGRVDARRLVAGLDGLAAGGLLL